MTLHNIALHLIGVGLFFALLALLYIICRLADRALVPPTRLSSARSSFVSLHSLAQDQEIPMIPMIKVEERKRFIQ